MQAASPSPNPNPNPPEIDAATMNYIMQHYFPDSPGPTLDNPERQLEEIVNDAIAYRRLNQLPNIKRKFVELKLAPTEVKRYATLMAKAGLISDVESYAILVQTLFQTRQQRSWDEIRTAYDSCYNKEMHERVFSHALQKWNEEREEHEKRGVRDYLRFLIRLRASELPVSELNTANAELLLNLGLHPEALLQGVSGNYNFGIIELAFRRGACIHPFMYNPPTLGSHADLLSSYFEWKKSSVGMEHLPPTTRNILELLKRAIDYDFNRCQTTQGAMLPNPLLVLALKNGDMDSFYYLADHPTIDLNKPIPICARVVGLILDTPWIPDNNAILQRYWTALRYLVCQKGGNINLGSPPPLLGAITRGNIKVVGALLDWGADVNVHQKGLGCWHCVFARVPVAQSSSQQSSNPPAYILTTEIRTQLTQLLIARSQQPSAVEFAFANPITEDEVLCLIQSGIQTNRSDVALGRTLLHAACTRGWVRCVGELVQKSVPVNTSTVSGVSPIKAAFNSRHFPIVMELLKAGATDVDFFSVGTPGQPSTSPVELILANGLYPLFLDILRKGATFGHLIFPTVNPDLLKYLSQNLAQLPAVIPEEQRQNPVAYLGSPQGRIGLLKVIKALGGKLTGRDFCLFSEAAKAQDIPFLRHLILDEGIEGGAVDPLGNSHLAILCRERIAKEKVDEWLQLMGLVLRKAPNMIKQPSQDGKTPLMLAVRSFDGDFRILQLLFEQGADIKAESKKGMNVLRFVTLPQEYSEKLILFLLEKGADLYAKDDFSIRPLHFFESHNLKLVLKYVLREFHSLHQKVDEAKTVLEFWNSLRMSDFLLTCPEVQQGRNPLEVFYLWRLNPGPFANRLSQEVYRRYVLELMGKYSPKLYKAQCLFLTEYLYEKDDSHVKKGKTLIDMTKTPDISINMLIQLFDEIIFDEDKREGHCDPRELLDKRSQEVVLRSPQFLREQLTKMAVRSERSPGEEFSLKHIAYHLLSIDDFDMRKKCLIALAFSARTANGFRQEALRQYEDLFLKRDAATLSDHVNLALRRFREATLLEIPGAQSLEIQNRLRNLLGFTEGLKSSVETIEKPAPGSELEKFLRAAWRQFRFKTSDCLELEQAVDKYLKKYSDQEFVMEWFSNHVPESWKAEEYQTLLQEVQDREQRGASREPIEEFLRTQGIAIKKIQTGAEAIQKACELACEVIRNQFAEYRRQLEQLNQASQIKYALEDHGIVLLEGQTAADALNQAEASALQGKAAVYESYEREIKPLLLDRERLAAHLLLLDIALEPIQTYEEAIRLHRSQAYCEEIVDKETSEIRYEARIYLLESLGVIREAAHPGLFRELCQFFKGQEERGPLQQQHKRKADPADSEKRETI